MNLLLNNHSRKDGIDVHLKFNLGPISIDDYFEKYVKDKNPVLFRLENDIIVWYSAFFETDEEQASVLELTQAHYRNKSNELHQS